MNAVTRKFPFDYSGLPEHIRDGAQLYIAHGIPPGSFLKAVICNDLSEACGRADDINRYRLYDIVSWFYNKAPKSAWGSEAAYERWIADRQLERT